VGLAKDSAERYRKELRFDLEERLLDDVQRPGGAGGGLFMADLKGSGRRMIYEVDPHGALEVAPEEVGLLTSNSDGYYDVTLGFPSEGSGKQRQAATGGGFKIPQQTIDVTIERNGKLTGTAVTAVTALQDGVQVLPLQLFPTLRVSGVWGPGGEALDFIQEDKMHDAEFAVILQKPLAAGESIEVTTSYAGKDAVVEEGGNNYFLVAREDWYPNKRGEFGNYAYYTMTFHTGKQMQVVATGNKLSDRDDGKGRTAVWQSLAPMPVAGFNLGDFKVNEGQSKSDVRVLSYANVALADAFSRLGQNDIPRNISGQNPLASDMVLGTLSTTGMLKRATSEGEAAVAVYTDFFGPLPYDHVSLTQQTACNYGQSWPTLVYLPICYFWDQTIQHMLGLLDADPTYWNVVTPHEVAHQWWGQTVGFSSYRDQWMSEGFANFSTALYLKAVNKTDAAYRNFWALLRTRLLEKNTQGLRPVDVGPVVMGTRVSTSKTGDDVYEMLIYSKGAYILHMLQMLYRDRDGNNSQFKVAMHDFVNSYRNQPATTEDFKAVMERNMPGWMDLDRNHKLDWFFNEYVYGTAVPKYTATSEVTKSGDDAVLHFKVSQSGVPDDFEMLVPVYLEFEDKHVAFFGRAKLTGSASVEQTVKLGKLAGVKRVVVNYNFDLLAE